MKFKNEDYVHFHCHSHFSNFDAVDSPEKMFLHARKEGFSALAVTDHGNIQAWPSALKYSKATKDNKGNDIPYPPIKAILGCEFYLARRMDVGQHREKRDPAESKRLQPDGQRGNRHINLFAMNFCGYQNICRLSQKSFIDGFYFKPRIDIELLSQHSEGVMISSACLSNIINQNLLYGKYDKAKEICGIFNEISSGNFFLEIMYHGIPEEKIIIPDILRLSTELNIPIVCSNDSHYVFKNQAPAQELLLCMSQQKCIKDPNRLRFSHHEFYLKSAEDMGRIFGDIPHALTNSVALAERIDTANIESNLFGVGMRLPSFKCPEKYKNPFDYLTHLAQQGMKRVGWDLSKKHRTALKKELEDIRIAYVNNGYDFATYFLIVRDYILYAKDNDILVGPGRGSGYGSVLLRCLDITYGVDPLEHGMLFERFLGFDNSRFIKESDFGFDQGLKLLITNKETNRELEVDLGGVDRYS